MPLGLARVKSGGHPRLRRAVICRTSSPQLPRTSVAQIERARTLPPHLARATPYGAAVTHRLRAMGIRDKTIAPASPWQKGFAERRIGSIRRECVDHIVVLGEIHLRRILTNMPPIITNRGLIGLLGRTLRFLAPSSTSAASSGPVLGGLHHHYCRIYVFSTDRGPWGDKNGPPRRRTEKLPF